MKKKLLFVINTLGGAGAERALINLLKLIPKEDYDIDLEVITGQGELANQLPNNVNLIGHHDPTPVLSKKGRLHLMLLCIGRFFSPQNGFKCIPYIIYHFARMKRAGNVSFDKLLWRMLANGMPLNNKTYDIAVSFIEGGATYYVANRIKAKKKIAFVHVDYEKAGYTRGLDMGDYHRFDKIFAVSEEITDPFLKVHPA
ncbi:MAG: glycosyltransferase, partial [Lachnospiraceae bacterium]|nr:glycosyltransferase [Lachnospiraceae bacterium]